jgi:hypothetical protein
MIERAPTRTLLALACLVGCGTPEIMSTRPHREAGRGGDPDGADDDQPYDAAPFDSFFKVTPNDVAPNVLTAPVCPGAATMPAATCDTIGVTIDPAYAGRYTCHDLGPVPGMPASKYGGLTLTLDRCSTKMLIGGDANLPDGALYAIEALRDADGHISGWKGPATRFADAPSNDGGVTFGPNKVLFLTHWPSNELQQTKFGSSAVDKLIDLEAMHVAFASASLAFVPTGFPMAGTLKLVSWSGGQWYTVGIAPDAQGTFDITDIKQDLTLMGGPEGFTYVAAGSPLFPQNSLLVSEWSSNKISTYETDDAANPKLATRHDFVTGFKGAEGAFRDPATGDFFFSTWGFTGPDGAEHDRVIVVRGFSPIIQ